jgi:hypothetical protein
VANRNAIHPEMGGQRRSLRPGLSSPLAARPGRRRNGACVESGRLYHPCQGGSPFWATRGFAPLNPWLRSHTAPRQFCSKIHLKTRPPPSIHKIGPIRPVSRGAPKAPLGGQSPGRLPQPIRRCVTDQANTRARWRRSRRCPVP